MPTGIWYFSVAVYDSLGTEGSAPDEVSKYIPHAPNAPTLHAILIKVLFDNMVSDRADIIYAKMVPVLWKDSLSLGVEETPGEFGE